MNKVLALLSLVVITLQPVHAESRYVSDRFEITLRTGPNVENKILEMIPSGVRLEILTPDEGGYTHVRKPGGEEGYVLSRYLADEPNARDQLASMRRRLSELQQEPGKITGQLSVLREQHDKLKQQHEIVVSESQAQQAKLESITSASANVVALVEGRDTLRAELKEMSQRVGQLQKTNRAYRNSDDREWFLIGAGVLLGGIILGLILPRLRRRRSTWSDL